MSNRSINGHARLFLIAAIMNKKKLTEELPKVLKGQKNLN